LRASSPLGLTFTVDFMQAVAGNVAPKAEFKGVTYDSDRPEIQLEVPRGGRDIQGESVYWVLPGGRCVCKSLREFACLPPADLAEASTVEAYAAAAEELDWYFLGLGPDHDVDEFREAPGLLSQRKWMDVEWRSPDKETTPCWWIVNHNGTDPHAKPRLICRSLASVHIEMKQHRFATREKLLNEKERRLASNRAAAEVMRQRLQTWDDVGGPAPELFEADLPTDLSLQGARDAIEALERGVAQRSTAGSSDDGSEAWQYAKFVKHLREAVDALRSTSWDAIYKELPHCGSTRGTHRRTDISVDIGGQTQTAM